MIVVVGSMGIGDAVATEITEVSTMIKALRDGKGLSQEELAHMAGISVRTLQRIEAGDAPSLESARGLAAALDVSLETIRGVTQCEEPPPNAVRHVKSVRGFYGHLAQYVLIMLLLLGINVYSSPGHLWVVYPALGWGLGVLMHAGCVFGWWPRLLGKDWERRQIERYLKRHGGE